MLMLHESIGMKFARVKVNPRYSNRRCFLLRKGEQYKRLGSSTYLTLNISPPVLYPLFCPT